MGLPGPQGSFGGGTGTIAADSGETLAAILGVGNTSGGTDISMSVGDQILTANGTVAAPGIQVGTSGGLGWFQSGAALRGAVGGIERILIAASQFTINGDLLFLGARKQIQNITADKLIQGSTGHRSGTCVTNSGAVGLVLLTLTSAEATGYFITYIVLAAQELRLDPGVEDKIIDPDLTGLVDGEYITSSSVGSFITLLRNADGDHVVVAKGGTWAEETP